ncbi:hypothetical protein [Virgibacillus litoralis]|uniref:TM2 domain-containing membrane protein YozV n=1 Tax=Virgibacillus litoralis TaxID=578221 RepID=A0ABS4HCL0_9BACI|nr:hypothetical protein [Virgibacillus litoralis]MBP1948650.1 TM2 domain-containing membrane protein YozV [Virgibacillus litoralis]
MQNYQNTDRSRRYKAYVSPLGTTQIHLRNPYVIAWWSAAIPGFGHLLLSKYLRGFLLFIWEIVINVNSKLNLSMVYTFGGQFDMAKEVLEPRWILLYIPVYIYAIWDSYRTSVDLNKAYILADHENASFINFQITSMEINYLDKRKPWMAVMWSFFMPGAGQIYIHRIVVAFFLVSWTTIIVYFSHVLESVHLLVSGDFYYAKAILNPQWLMFLPSVYFFSIYDAYVNTVENNKLFDSEQRTFLKKKYQNKQFNLPLNLIKRSK